MAGLDTSTMDYDYTDIVDDTSEFSLDENHDKSVQDSVLLQQIKQLDRKFYISCRQVVLLNNHIEELKSRYDRATEEDNRSFMANISLRIASIEGVRNMFYEYVCSRSDLLDVLHEQLLSLGIIDYDMDLSTLYDDNS